MQDCPGAAITVSDRDGALGLAELQGAVAQGSSSARSIIAMYDGSSADTTGLSPYPVGVLIFSVVAHVGLIPASNITTDELFKIFVQLGEPDKVAVGRLAGSGSRKSFFANVLHLNPAPPPYQRNCQNPTGNASSFTSCTEDSTAGLLDFVNRTRNAISYAETFGLLNGYPQVSQIKIDGFAPSRDNVLNGNYKFWTVEHLYTATQPTALTKDFLEFFPLYLEANPPVDFIPCSDGLKRLGADC
jgi:ABC-type phosphate transport system substrate-binding protein